MNLTLQRELSTVKSTPGKLFLNGVFESFTLEDVVRERRYDDGSLIEVSSWKVPNETAIPSGRYPVVIDYSTRFKRQMPHIMGVPGFEGVRIHWGNWSVNTEGCVLLGRVRNSFDEILQSRLAFDVFFTKLSGSNEQHWITIEPAMIVTPPTATIKVT